ncbi:MAG: IS630 family transposase, partial [Actinomycetota bacterium]|nr:IS630 family transposase [Actinomycetota bacterium]
RKRAVLLEWLPSQLENNPDLTLDEHCGAFEEDSGVRVSRATMRRATPRLAGGRPLKESLP